MMERAFAVPIERIPISHSRSILATCAVFLGIAWITVGVRFWTRARIVRAVGWDDRWMLFTMVLFTAFCVSASLHACLISERTILSESLMTAAVNFLLLGEVFYILTMLVLKIALALFFLRIIVDPWQRRIVYTALTVSTVFSTAYFFYAVFQCGVPYGSSFWVKQLSGQCAGTASILGMGYTHALVNALTDLTFTSLSIPILRTLQIKSREKVIIGGIFFLASIGCIASFIRLPYVKALTRIDLGYFKNLRWLIIWSAVEPGLGIIAASLATLRPLLRKLESKFDFLTTNYLRTGSLSKPTPPSSYPSDSNRNQQSRSSSRSRLRSQSCPTCKITTPQKEKMGSRLGRRQKASNDIEMAELENYPEYKRKAAVEDE